VAKSYVDEMAGEGRRRGPEKAKFDVSEYVLTQMALAFLTTNALSTHRLRTKLLEFLDYVDEEQYTEAAEKRWRLALARGIGNAVLKHGARSLPAVEHRVMEDTEWAEWHASFFEAYRNDTGHAVEGYVLENELSDEDIRYVEGFASTRLRYAYLWAHTRFFQEVATSIETGDMGNDVERFHERVMVVLERLVQRARTARAVGVAEAQDFYTGESSFEAAIRSAHAARNRPQALVRTGLRLMNDMLGGGYQGGRVYVHMAASGDGKSIVLNNAAFWCCDPRFNPEFVTKDPTRKPCCILLSQENGLFETVERMLSFALGSHVDLRGADANEIVRMMEEAFSSETCRLAFKYRQSRSITTADVDAMIHDEYLKGYEVVCIVQDYIKRIKAVEQFRDQRHLELGAVVDELRIVADRHGIPVITAMQLNRDAYAKLEAAMKAGKTDAVKELGASNVGESINVYENADCVIMQRRVTSEALEGRQFMTFNRIKRRGKSPPGPSFFAQPFDLDEEGNVNGMKFVEDSHLPVRRCAGLKDVGDGLAQMYDPNAAAGGTSPEERRASRDAAALAGQPRRRSSGRDGPKRVVPENAGTATLDDAPPNL